MASYSKTVLLRMSHEQATRYHPPCNISVNWMVWNHSQGTVIAQFFHDDCGIFYDQRKSKWDLENELYNNPQLHVIYEFDREPTQPSKEQVDILLDDVVIDNLPHGNRHKITGEHQMALNNTYYEQLKHIFKNRFGTDKKPSKELRVGHISDGF